MDGSTVKLATSDDVKDRLPAFVYGTLQTGFKNHNNTVRGRHSAAAPARLPGAVVLDFSVGFPGMYPCPGESSSAPTSGTLAFVYSADILTALRAKVEAAGAALSATSAADIAAKGVVGELLFFDEDAGASSPGAGSGGPCTGVGWPAVLADLDRLEDFTAPGHRGNMYERVRVEVLARRSQLPADVAAASRPAVAVAASPEGAVGGAGATAEPAAASAAADAAGDSADDWVWVTAWSYFCLIDIRQPSLEATLVPDGNWRRHMAEHRKQDAADDWATQAGVAPPKGADAPAGAPSTAPAVAAADVGVGVSASGGAASMPE